MNDFDFDAMQKKRIARGAAHMKRGSKSRKCTLPSDYLTAAQLKRRNGPMQTYNLNTPMSWLDFKAMPRDLQQAYINNLQSRFGVSLTRIGRDLFGTSDSTLRVYASQHGLKYSTDGTRAGMKAPEVEIWMSWLHPTEEIHNLEKPDEEITEVPWNPEIPKEPEMDPEVANVVEGFRNWAESLPERIVLNPEPEVVVAVAEESVIDLDELTAVFTGKFDPEKFLLWVSKLPVPDANVRIKMEVTKV